MKPRIGRKVVLVLLEANVERKDVAAETGMEKSSYSSAEIGRASCRERV